MVNQVYSTYYKLMKTISAKVWEPSKETLQDLQGAQAQTNAYRFPAKVMPHEPLPHQLEKGDRRNGQANTYYMGPITEFLVRRTVESSTFVSTMKQARQRASCLTRYSSIVTVDVVMTRSGRVRQNGASPDVDFSGGVVTGVQSTLIFCVLYYFN